MQIGNGCGCTGPTDNNNNTNDNQFSDMTMEEIYHNIKMYTFAVQDTALYLDTHPNDLDVLKRHNEFSKMLDKANEAYKQFNNPIDNTGTSSGFWHYIEGPWAAQNMDWRDNE